ncbi:DUF3667 domain-containing protein [Sphingomonas sp. HT-1]|uniref:DUF3667 domain-containing protein n=1 Tax=unclassified Sphingomonas TaxID=196159 RepID=UPI0002D70FDD|nr:MULTISPECIES: DUF3667 domain-containing protein [unclassified Sphingomonas]KTF70475.1 hypothetical protein ATB93_04375 [Sphingomonas sp. WG]
MGEFDAAGELVTGGLLGRAVEPRAGEGHGHGHGTICLNCGTALIGPHCHECGQSGHVHRSLGAIGHELLHGVAHFEGKMWRTLPLLAWRPGDLTRRYIAGERARFVSPMAMFLFSIFTMFAIFQILGISAPTDLETATARPAAAIQHSIEKAESGRARKAAKLAKLDANDSDRAELQEDIAKADRYIAKYKASAAQLPQDESEIPEGFQTNTGWHTLDYGIEKWQKNPALMLYKLQASIYKFSWLLIPLSVPFVWLLFFWKRQYKLYDHAVFVTYSIAAMSLLFIVVTLLSAVRVPDDALMTIAMVVPPVHLCVQLKQAYGLRWRSAILRTIVLLWFIGIIALLFLAILALLGIMG